MLQVKKKQKKRNNPLFLCIYLTGGKNMDKDIVLSNYNHSINLLDRKNLNISGVKKIESFDENEFVMDTVMGFLVISGSDLELVKMDSLEQKTTIKGNVNSMVYIEENKASKKENSIFNRLFK